jgi:hypothetical protein
VQIYKRPIAAALILPFVLATPATGQDLTDTRSAQRIDIIGPSYVPAPDPANRPIASQVRSGLSVTTMPYAQDDGALAVRRGVVGSMPVSNQAEFRVGLLEVTRTSHKERALARTQPMKEVYGRTDRIAAIGLNIRF